LFLFYVMFELMLVPMYLIIGIWGGTRRIYSTLKFVIFTLAGSLVMLVGIVAIWLASGPEGSRTLSLPDLLAIRNRFSAEFQFWVFLAFGLAFAIKLPMFPFHTWLPDAHVEAPTAGSIILAGVLLKAGGYGFLRFALPLFPTGTQLWLPLIIVLSVIAILYGAAVSTVQKDLKKLVAYSSVAHMGFVTLGIFVLNAQGGVGAVLQMLNHAFVTGALFLFVGIQYERTHRRVIADLGGLANHWPLYTTFFGVFVLASLGLPGLSGFVGEFLVLLGTFQFGGVPLGGLFWGPLAAIGVILAAIYLLWMFSRVMYGPARDHRRRPRRRARRPAVRAGHGPVLRRLCERRRVHHVLPRGVHPPCALRHGRRARVSLPQAGPRGRVLRDRAVLDARRDDHRALDRPHHALRGARAHHHPGV